MNALQDHENIQKKIDAGHIYDILVDRKCKIDPVGMIAYSIYKKSKIEHIEKQRGKQKSITPKQWRDSHCTPTYLNGLLEDAQGFLDDYIEIVQEEYRSKLEESFKEREKSIEDIKAKCPNKTNIFWQYLHGVFQNCIAAVFIIFIVYGISKLIGENKLEIRVVPTNTSSQTNSPSQNK